MATYQFVPEHNGIEIYFDVKPSDDVLEELRGNGWRWHRVKECWFTKKSASAEALARKLCSQTQPPAPVSQASQVTIQQSSGSIFISTLTIFKNNQGYSWSSTNNQVICCDCNRFFSIHASACPFCGCPTSYIAEHYYSKFDPEVMRQQKIEEEKRRQAEQKRIKQEEDKQKKENLINRIATCWYGDMASDWHYTFDIRWRMKSMSLSALTVAAERADIMGRPMYPISISVETYVDILNGTNANFQKALRCFDQIKARPNELPAIGDKEWHKLISLTGSDFNARLIELVEIHKLRQEAAAKEAKRRWEEKSQRMDDEINTMFGRYHIEGELYKSLIKRYGSDWALLQRLQLIDDIGGEFRHKIDLVKFIDSPEALKAMIKTLK